MCDEFSLLPTRRLKYICEQKKIPISLQPTRIQMIEALSKQQTKNITPVTPKMQSRPTLARNYMETPKISISSESMAKFTKSTPLFIRKNYQNIIKSEHRQHNKGIRPPNESYSYKNGDSSITKVFMVFLIVVLLCLLIYMMIYL